MSKLTYDIGYTLGVITREFLRGLKTASRDPLQTPCISPRTVDELCRVPAMVRAQNINLDQRHETNVLREKTPSGASSTCHSAPESRATHKLSHPDTSATG